MTRFLFFILAFVALAGGQSVFANVSLQSGPALYCMDADTVYDSGNGYCPAGSSSDPLTICPAPRHFAYGHVCFTENYGDSFNVKVATAPPFCPTGSTRAGNSCVCNALYTEENGVCKPPPAPDPQKVCSDLNASGAPLLGKGTPTLNIVFNGVQVRGSGAAGGFKNGVSTGFEVFGPFTCSAVSAPTVDTSSGPIGSGASPSPSTCSGYWGSVNGVDTCVPKAPTTPSTSGATSGTTTTTQTTSGGTTGATPTTTGTTSTRDTTCENGACTTTTTTNTTPSGGGSVVTSTTSTTEPQTDFCKANPTSPMCAAADPCKENPDSLSCSKFGTPDTGIHLPSADAGFQSIAAVAFADASTCPADLHFTAMGRSYAISYGAMCDTATSFIRPVVLLLGFGLAAFIFAGGFKV